MPRSSAAARLAARDAVFAAARSESTSGALGRANPVPGFDPERITDQPSAATVEAAFSFSRLEAVTPSPTRQVAAGGGTLTQHQGTKAETADLAALADPLAAGLAHIV